MMSDGDGGWARKASRFLTLCAESACGGVGGLSHFLTFSLSHFLTFSHLGAGYVRRSNSDCGVRIYAEREASHLLTISHCRPKPWRKLIISRLQTWDTPTNDARHYLNSLYVAIWLL